MKKLILGICSVASIGTLMAVGKYSPPASHSTEFQPKVVSPSSPQVMQSADCTPTPTPDPGGHPKKLKVPAPLPPK